MTRLRAWWLHLTRTPQLWEWDTPEDLFWRLLGGEESEEKRPSVLRIDTEGRDVTDLPGLWDESDQEISRSVYEKQ